MTKLNRMSWVVDCLANQWEHCAPEEVVQQVIQGESEDAERLDRVRSMVNDWYNDNGGARIKYQMAITLDAEDALKEFISSYIQTSRG